MRAGCSEPAGEPAPGTAPPGEDGATPITGGIAAGIAPIGERAASSDGDAPADTMGAAAVASNGDAPPTPGGIATAAIGGIGSAAAPIDPGGSAGRGKVVFRFVARGVGTIPMTGTGAVCIPSLGKDGPTEAWAGGIKPSTAELTPDAVPGTVTDKGEDAVLTAGDEIADGEPAGKPSAGRDVPGMLAAGSGEAVGGIGAVELEACPNHCCSIKRTCGSIGTLV